MYSSEQLFFDEKYLPYMNPISSTVGQYMVRFLNLILLTP